MMARLAFIPLLDQEAESRLRIKLPLRNFGFFLVLASASLFAWTPCSLLISMAYLLFLFGLVLLLLSFLGIEVSVYYSSLVEFCPL